MRRNRADFIVKWVFRAFSVDSAISPSVYGFHCCHATRNVVLLCAGWHALQPMRWNNNIPIYRQKAKSAFPDFFKQAENNNFGATSCFLSKAHISISICTLGTSQQCLTRPKWTHRICNHYWSATLPLYCCMPSCKMLELTGPSVNYAERKAKLQQASRAVSEENDLQALLESGTSSPRLWNLANNVLENVLRTWRLYPNYGHEMIESCLFVYWVARQGPKLLDGKKNKLSSMLIIYKKLCIAVCPNTSCDSMFCTLLFISEPDGIDLSTWIWSASLVVCMPWRGVHSGGELASSMGSDYDIVCWVH